MKYVAPEMEVIKYEFKNNVLTASEFKETESPVEGNDPVEPSDYDPFA